MHLAADCGGGCTRVSGAESPAAYLMVLPCRTARSDVGLSTASEASATAGMNFADARPPVSGHREKAPGRNIPWLPAWFFRTVGEPVAQHKAMAEVA